jgi:hypothetical protein
MTVLLLYKILEMKKLVNLFIIIAISINANAQIVIDSTNIVPTCLDCDSIGVVPLPNSYGSFYIEVSGGVPPYTFSLTGDHPANLTPVNVVSSGSASYTQLCQDTFQLAILDNGGASSFFYFSTIPPPPPTFNIDSVSVKADSTNNPDSGVIELHVTTNADSIFYKIQEQNNSFPLGTLGGWQDSTIFDSLLGGYSYKVFVDIYPKVLSCGTGQLDTGSTVLLIYVPLACENDGFAAIFTPPSACVGDVVTIDGFSYAGSGINNFIVAENWDLGDGFNTPGPVPFTHVYTQAGTFWINYFIMTSHGCTFYEVVPITIDPLPIPSYSSTDNGTGLFSFTDNSLGTITTWFWDFGDGNTSTFQNPNHQYTIPNTYSVCLTVTTGNGCVDTFCGNVTYSTSVGINELANENGLKIYPNPSNNQITIIFNESQTGSLVINDVSGRMIKQVELKATKKQTVNIEKLSSGIYFINYNGKVVKLIKN